MDLQQLNDQLRQRAHAEEQKLKLEGRRLTPEDRQAKEAEAKMRSIATAAAEAAIRSLTIQNGQNVTISGSGRNITIGANLVDPNAQNGQGGAAAGIWQSMTDCDGNTFDVWVRNIQPP